MTAVDSSVLIDVFGADPEFGLRSKRSLESAIRDGSLVACEVVWAEVVSVFPSAAVARDSMSALGVAFDAIDEASALAAGSAWRRYRDRGGGRVRVAADFLIGAHASMRADRLLTRDRGFYRDYFTMVRVLDPTENNSA